jgi:NAD(P) transhydrogenase subunit alpha
VHAFDVRPEVAEQIESMGANFVFLDFAESQTDGAATGGYAAPSSPEFREAQLKKFRELAPEMDIVITTALIPGRKAPVLVTEEMVMSMKAGSVIVDMAVEQGGNCPLSEPGRTVTKHGVHIIGETNLPSMVAADASALYARNVIDFLKLVIDADGKLKIDLEDDIVKACLVVRDGQVLRA